MPQDKHYAMQLEAAQVLVLNERAERLSRWRRDDPAEIKYSDEYVDVGIRQAGCRDPLNQYCSTGAHGAFFFFSFFFNLGVLGG
jgi:hypothetical protein